MDLLTLIVSNKLALLIFTVFVGSAIWGQEYVAQLFEIIGKMFERAAASIGGII